MNNTTSNQSGSAIGNPAGTRRHHPRLSKALVAGALVLGGTAATMTQPGGAAARYPAPTEAEVRQSELGWALSAHFPNVRAWPESFGSLAFPNKCQFISVVVCP